MKHLEVRDNLSLHSIKFVPHKLYNKLSSFGAMPPCDITLPEADLTIFPNYIAWPTVKSKLTATVIHDLTFLYYPEHAEGGSLRNLKEDHATYLRRVVKHAVKRSDFIITVSESVKVEISEAFNLHPDRIFVTPNTPAVEYFQPRTSDAFKKFAIPTEKYLLHIGTLQPRKNPLGVVEAYLQLPEAIRKEYSLVLAGGWGWKSDDIKEAVQEAQRKGENIITTGYYDFADVNALYQQAAACIMFSHYEGFGMQALEAMASNTPVIASNIPVFREIAGDAALYTRANDPADLSEKITSLLGNPALQDKLVRKGQKNLERFSWERTTESLEVYCQSLLQAQQRPQ